MQLTLGCRMLHYTGIGSPSCLIFENEKPIGETNVLVGLVMVPELCGWLITTNS